MQQASPLLIDKKEIAKKPTGNTILIVYTNSLTAIQKSVYAPSRTEMYFQIGRVLLPCDVVYRNARHLYYQHTYARPIPDKAVCAITHTHLITTYQSGVTAIFQK
jgi:hypothetical protein